MEEEKQVANTEVQVETPPVESTPQETTTQQTPTESGTVAKEQPTESVDRLDKHPRFQELNKKSKEAARQAEEYRRLYEEAITKKETPPVAPTDPYANLSPEEKEQTKAFIDKFVLPEVQKRYEPFVQQVQTERLNKQIDEAKTEANQFGINFDEKLPEVVDYLSRPENKGRLTAKEAFRNLYFEEMTGAVKTKTAEELSKQQQELMEKKKQANMQATTVSPNSVIQSNEMARSKMSKEERLQADIRESIALAKQGIRNPNVKVD